MRAYRQYCGIAKALDVVGGRWSLLIVRELLLGPRRYSELQANLIGVTPNLLADRLRELEAAGVVEPVDAPDGGNRHAWALTEWGRMLEPALLALGSFGARRMTNPVGHRTNGRWFAVSLQRRYRGGMPDTSVALVIDDEPYTLSITSNRLISSDGLPDNPSLTIKGSLRAVAGTLSTGRPAEGTLSVLGKGALLRQLRSSLD